MEEAVKDILVELYLNPKLTVAQVCAEAGIRPPALYQVLAERGISPSRRTTDLPKDLLTESEPLGVGSLTLRFGVNPIGVESGNGTVSRDAGLVIKEARDVSDVRGVTARYSKRFREEVVKMYEEKGMSGAAIAKTSGVPYNHVLKILRSSRVNVLPGNEGRTWGKHRVELLDDFRDPALSLSDIITKHGDTAMTLWKATQRDPELNKIYNQLAMRGEGRAKVNAVIEEVLARVREELYSEGLLGRRGDAVRLVEGAGEEAGLLGTKAELAENLERPKPVQLTMFDELGQ